MSAPPRGPRLGVRIAYLALNVACALIVSLALLHEADQRFLEQRSVEDAMEAFDFFFRAVPGLLGGPADPV